MAFGSAALKFIQTAIYVLLFLCAAVILVIYSYFLAEETHNHIHIPTTHRAIEGISGIAVCYTIAAVLFTCCLGGTIIFALLGMILDIAFAGAFIYIAIKTGDGATSCRGQTVTTPLGNGSGDSHISFSGESIAPRLRTVCHMESAVFAVAIIGAFLFIVAALMQLCLGRVHRKNKAYGPGPSNNYTSGPATTGRRGRFTFFRRHRRGHAARDAEVAGAGAGIAAAIHHHDNHPHAAHNGVMHDQVGYVDEKPGHLGHGHVADSGIPTAGGYHSGPTGSAVNPYRSV